MRWHVAQANIATMRYSMDDPRMAGFAERLDPLSELADASPGFVWRYETPDGDTTEAEVFGETALFNLSVWESLEALESYVYRSAHVEAVRKRADWFERGDRAPLVLWWVEAGHRPSVHEARERFELLWSEGPVEDAFTFRNRFPPPVAAGRDR